MCELLLHLRKHGLGFVHIDFIDKIDARFRHLDQQAMTGSPGPTSSC